MTMASNSLFTSTRSKHIAANLEEIFGCCENEDKKGRLIVKFPHKLNKRSVELVYEAGNGGL